MTITVGVTTDEPTQVAIDVKKIQVVAVVFSELGDQKEYYYFAPLEARTGQYAVVYDQNNRNGEFPFKVVRIVRDNVIDVHGKANKSIWGSFDETFAKQVQERCERMASVRGQLEAKKKAFQEREMYNVMAATDPTVAALLAELSEFGL